jgi:hypothetical protein
MAILTFDQLKGAQLNRVEMKRTSAVTAAAAQPTTVWQAAGFPGAGVLAIGNTTSGIKPVAGTVGYPPIRAFAGGAKGEVSRLVISNTVAGIVELFDSVWAAGAFPFNANQAISAPPSYSDRVPDGTDFGNLLLHVEAVTAFTGNPSFNITYTRGDGTTGRSTGVVASGAALGIARGLFLPLQAGDNSVQAITNVACTVATAGTFNVRVLRRLGEARGDTVNWQDVQDWFRTGGPEVFATSALYPIVTPDSTSTGLPRITVDIRSA